MKPFLFPLHICSTGPRNQAAPCRLRSLDKRAGDEKINDSYSGASLEKKQKWMFGALIAVERVSVAVCWDLQSDRNYL